MGKRFNRWTVCLVLVFLVATSVGPQAEVSCDTAHEVILLMLGIIEGPDPIPQIWDPVREVSANLILNPDGGSRGDGRPAAAYNPNTFWPVVVWAYQTGADRDIAFSAWVGEPQDNLRWSGIEFLTSSSADEVDPRAFVSDVGTIYVVWWDADSSSVWMSTRAAGISTWVDPEPVTGLVDEGRRPTILEWEGTVLTAYERDSSRSGQEVVVATRVSTGVYSTEVAATTMSDTPLNVILHNERGVLWMDWRHSADEYAYSIYTDGAWAPLETMSWTEDSWSRDEEARRVIRGVVLSQ